MAQISDFVMERWQSTYENQVDCNLSESGVHPVTLGELVQLSGRTFDSTPISYGQSNGTDQLRQHIAALYDNASPDLVTVTNGSAEANLIALWTLVEPGDEVVILLPTYMQTVGLCEALGATVREVWLREDLGWQPDPDEITAAVTSRTRAIVVTNPNNPTGSILNEAARQAIVAAAERTGAWILADEVYRGAELSGSETASFHNTAERVIATGSLSKAYGLPGLRIGWTISPVEMTGPLWARKDYTTIGPGQLTDSLAAVALAPEIRPKLLQRTRRYIRDGLAVLEPWLAEMQVFHYRRPEAGAILWARYDLPINSSTLIERLRAEQSVLLVAGDHFRMDHHLRFGPGIEPSLLRDALRRVSEGMRLETAKHP